MGCIPIVGCVVCAVVCTVSSVGKAVGCAVSSAAGWIGNNLGPVALTAAAVLSGNPELLAADTAAAADLGTLGFSTVGDVASGAAGAGSLAGAGSFVPTIGEGALGSGLGLGSATVGDVASGLVPAGTGLSIDSATGNILDSTGAVIGNTATASPSLLQQVTTGLKSIPSGIGSLANSLLGSPSASPGSLGSALYDALGNLITSGVGPGALLAATAYKCAEALNQQAMAPYTNNIQQMANFGQSYATGAGLPQLNVTYGGQPIKAAPGSATAVAPMRTAQNVVYQPKAKDGGMIRTVGFKKGGEVKKPVGIEHVMVQIEKVKPAKKEELRKIKGLELNQKIKEAIKRVQLIKKINPTQYMQLVERGKKVLTQQGIHKTIQKEKIKKMTPRVKQAIGTPSGGLQSMLSPTSIPNNIQDLINSRNQPISNALKTNPQLLAKLMQLKNTRQQTAYPTAQGGIPMAMAKKGGHIPEIDYRDNGGFVPPIGKKERADDIPAMLSNNEFVFTAKAVRNAGKGDVKKGAKEMYALMKKLEGKKG